jgi:hypothetical protein
VTSKNMDLDLSIERIVKLLKSDLVHVLDEEKVISLLWDLAKRDALTAKAITNSATVVSELSKRSQEFLRGAVTTTELLYPMLQQKKLTM